MLGKELQYLILGADMYEAEHDGHEQLFNS
jgi:hypothetical protein